MQSIAVRIGGARKVAVLALVAVLGSLLLAASPALAQVSFSGPANFSAGNGPREVAVGDFDGDSDPDLAVTNAVSDNVSVLVGGAGGSFSDPTNFAAGDQPSSVAVDDFDGDSRSDLVVANFISDNVSVLLNDPNDAPVAADHAYSTEEDTTLSVSAPGGVLSNDSDTGGDTLTAELVSGPSNADSFTLNQDGSFTYTPAANYNGSDSFTYKANDGTADSNVVTVTITVNPVNDAPSFTSGGNVSVAEDSGAYSAPWATGISKGPADESSQTLTFQVTGNTNTALFSSGPSITDDGTLSFTPAANATGSATITVVLKDDGSTANDGQDTSAPVTFTITVNALNDPPTLTTNAGLTLNEGATAIINNSRLNVTDIDNPAADLVYTLDAVPTNGTLKNNGTPLSAGGTFTQEDINANLLSYEHNGSETASDSFGFTVADGAGGTISSTIFTITVTPLNDPPTITVAAGGSCSTTSVSGTMNLTVGDTETAAGSLTVSRSSSNTTLVPNANITFGGSAANRTVTITPAAKKSGTATITITVGDGAASSTTTIKVIVGTDKKETINGTSGSDMIFGLNGDDTINAGNANDLVCGGNGGGVISGGAGDDTLDGGNGNDTLRGEDGNDILRGGQGNDRLEGGNNDDTLTGGMGADSFIGDAGTDVATDFNAAEGDTKDATVP